MPFFHFRTPDELVVRGTSTGTGGIDTLMEDPPGETQSSYHFPPYSERELNTLYGALHTADSDMEKKQILTSYGLTVDEAQEYFRGYPGYTDPPHSKGSST